MFLCGHKDEECGADNMDSTLSGAKYISTEWVEMAVQCFSKDLFSFFFSKENKG